MMVGALVGVLGIFSVLQADFLTIVAVAVALGVGVEIAVNRFCTVRVGTTLKVVRETRTLWTVHMVAPGRRLAAAHVGTTFQLTRQIWRDFGFLEKSVEPVLPAGTVLQMDTWLARSDCWRESMHTAGWERSTLRTATFKRWQHLRIRGQIRRILADSEPAQLSGEMRFWRYRKVCRASSDEPLR